MPSRSSGLPPLVGQVESGLKPSAYVSLDEAQGQVLQCEDLGLEVLPAPIPGYAEHAQSEGHTYRPEYAISYTQPAADLLTSHQLPTAVRLGARRGRILSQLSVLTVSEALVKLHAYPRTDDEFAHAVGVPGYPRPEVAWAQGALLGYKPCCIEYFLDTRYFGEDRQSLELQIGPLQIDGQIYCEECMLVSIEQAQARGLLFE